MTKINETQFNLLADKLIKKQEQRMAVKIHVIEGASAYEAEMKVYSKQVNSVSRDSKRVVKEFEFAMLIANCASETKSRLISIGDRYNTASGIIEVLRYIDSKNVKIRFLDTNAETVTTASNARTGNVRDKLKPSVRGVGFIGYGKHSSKLNGARTDMYIAWKNMINRCYDEYTHKRQPTYIGCTVCNEWHNFQNFAEWYLDNHPNDGIKYQLDKDIKTKGNKIYSPETCTFVTQLMNLANRTFSANG